MGALAIDSVVRMARGRLSARGWLGGVSGLAAVALVLDPAGWLAETWRDPAYQSDGGWVGLLVVGLVLWSVRSGGAQTDRRAAGLAWRLLLGTAAARVLGHLLAVDTIGALALVVDVAAVSIALGVDRRPFALRPLALAALACLALPVEHLLQRLLGHPLQLAAAWLAAGVLRPFDPALVREGVLLLHPDVALAVDLPCSGARGLMLLSGVALACWCRRAVSPRQALAGFAAVAVGALGANALRVVLLYVAARAGWPLQHEPWHSAIGCAVLGMGALPVFAVAARATPRCPRWRRPFGVERPRPWARRVLRIPDAAIAGLLLVAAATVAWTPEQPLDVSAPVTPRPLPANLGARIGEAVPTSDLERRYFERYGGSVSKRSYHHPHDGTRHVALLVRTAAPLRHLHGPDQCLIGAGHTVTRLGVRHASGAAAAATLPTVVYRSVAPDGRVWRVEASYLDDAGHTAASVSEVLWRWLQAPHAWSLVERISPWQLCEQDPARCSGFDADLFGALELAASPAIPRHDEHEAHEEPNS